MGDRDLFFERASKDGKGGDWCIMEKIEGELEPVPAVSSFHYFQYEYPLISSNSSSR